MPKCCSYSNSAKTRLDTPLSVDRLVLEIVTVFRCLIMNYARLFLKYNGDKLRIYYFFLRSLYRMVFCYCILGEEVFHARHKKILQCKAQ